MSLSFGLNWLCLCIFLFWTSGCYRTQAFDVHFPNQSALFTGDNRLYQWKFDWRLGGSVKFDLQLARKTQSEKRSRSLEIIGYENWFFGMKNGIVVGIENNVTAIPEFSTKYRWVSILIHRNQENLDSLRSSYPYLVTVSQEKESWDLEGAFDTLQLHHIDILKLNYPGEELKVLQSLNMNKIHVLLFVFDGRQDVEAIEKLFNPKDYQCEFIISASFCWSRYFHVSSIQNVDL